MLKGYYPRRLFTPTAISFTVYVDRELFLAQAVFWLKLFLAQAVS
jgi:hypothetical protein